LLDHNQAFVAGRRRDHVAINAFAFLGKPLDKRGRVTDFTHRFVQWLALFQGHDPGQIVFVLQDQFKPATQDLRAVFGRAFTPGWQGCVGGLDGADRFGAAHQRHIAQQLALGRVGHVDRLTAVGICPGAIYKRLLTKQLGVFELHAGHSSK